MGDSLPPNYVVDSFDFDSLNNTRLSHVKLLGKSNIGLFDYRPAIAALVLAAAGLIASVGMFWYFYTKEHSIFFLANACILSIILLIVVVCLGVLWHAHAHRGSILFQELTPVRNKEVFIGLVLLISGTYLAALVFGFLAYAARPFFQINITHDGQHVLEFLPRFPEFSRACLIPLGVTAFSNSWPSPI